MATPSPAPSNDSTVGALLAAQASRRGDAPAYVDAGQRHSYAAVDQDADQLARGLLALGLQRGDRIGVMALNGLPWLQVFFAATRIGLVVVALSTRYRDSELAYMVADSQVKALFTVPSHEGFDFFAMVDRLLPQTPELRHVVGLGARSPQHGLALDDLRRPEHLATVQPAALAQAVAAVQPADLAMVIYTSGTTGRPKGAGLSHASLLASARAQASHTRSNEDDVMQLANPLNHVGGITCGILASLMGGGLVQLVPEFKVNLVLDMMAELPPTLMGGVPTMLTLLLMSPRSAEADMSRVRLIFSGGSNVDATLIEQLTARMPQARMMNLYGLSESSGAVVMTPWDSSREQVLGSIGKPLPGIAVKVVGGDGQTLPAGEVGELCFLGGGVIAGYVGAASSIAAIDDQGWLHTGDLGLVDSDGFIWLKGRKKDMYIQGGFNVYPAETETVLLQHPDIVMAAVIGVPDPVLGEIGRVYIVARPGSGLSDGAVRQFARDHLADYKVPRQVVLREELPLTPAGKIHKAALRQGG